jgi:hypothetical protein
MQAGVGWQVSLQLTPGNLASLMVDVCTFEVFGKLAATACVDVYPAMYLC